VTSKEAQNILWHCHNSPYGGHFNGERTVAKVLQSSFYWPTLFKDAHMHVQHCDKCQRTGNISRDMKCLCKTFKRSMCLIVGELILWARYQARCLMSIFW